MFARPLFPDYPIEAGQTITFTEEGVKSYLAFLSACITAVDEQAIMKFSLPYKIVQSDGTVVSDNNRELG